MKFVSPLCLNQIFWFCNLLPQLYFLEQINCNYQIYMADKLVESDSVWLSWLTVRSRKGQTWVWTPEKESFAFAPWCWVQDDTRRFLSVGGETSGIREQSPVPRMTRQEEFITCSQKGREENGTLVCVANSPSRWTHEKESRIDGGREDNPMINCETWDICAPAHV